jgi:hypothetical protein
VAAESAAALHGFDTFRPGPLRFLVPAVQRNRRVAGTVRSSAAPTTDEDRCLIGAIPCTSPARTIFDSAAVVSRHRLEHAIDSGMRDGAFSEDDLTSVLDRLRESGRNGVRRLEAALAITAGPPAHSVLERRFLRLVQQHGLPMPKSQVTFVDDDQRFVARVDFLFEGVVIVEVEGHRFHATRAQRQRDNRRRNALERAGSHVLVFTYEDVRDRPGYVAREVTLALRSLVRAGR